MQLSTFLLAFVAAVAAAQTATSSAPATTTSSTCAAQNILDACIPIIQGQVNSCGVTDYACLCTQYQNMLTCYINCPSDPGVFTVQQQREQNCIAASVYGSTTTLGTAPAATSAASATTTGSSSDTSIHTGFASETGSSATSTTSSSATGNGAVGFEIAGGLVAVALGGLGFVL